MKRALAHKTTFCGAGKLVAAAPAIILPFTGATLSITELAPTAGQFVGKTVKLDGHIEQYSGSAFFRQHVTSIPATIPSLFRYLRDDARKRNVFLIRGAPACLERRRTRRQIAHIIHGGVDRGDHGFTDQPTALFFLDFDGVAGKWQADPEAAVKDIVARLGAPYSDTDFVWFFSSSHGLKLDKKKVWRGKLSDTDVRVRIAFIAARPLKGPTNDYHRTSGARSCRQGNAGRHWRWQDPDHDQAACRAHPCRKDWRGGLRRAAT